MKSVYHPFFIYMNNFLTGKRAFLSLGLIWLIVQFYLCFSLGVRIAYDSPSFIGPAQMFNANKQDVFDFRSTYAFYVLLVSFFIKFKNGINLLIGFQIFLSGLATVAFYSAVKRVSDSYLAPYLSTLLLLGWLDLQRWQFYVMTEPFFLDLLLFLFWGLTYLNNVRQYIFIFIVLILISFTRPNGFLAIPATIFALGMKHTSHDKQWRYKMLLVFILVFPVWLWLANIALKNMGVKFTSWQYSFGSIIQGYRNLHIFPNKSLMIPIYDSPFLGILSLIWQEPIFFIKASFFKIFFYLSTLRPYFSLQHNLANGFLIIFTYSWAVYGWLKLKKLDWIKAFAATFWFLNVGVIVLLAPDWDNRFIAPSLLIAIAFAGIGLNFRLKTKIDPKTPHCLASRQYE